MKPYLYICKIRIQKALAYKFDVFANIILQCIVMFAASFFWRALYEGKEYVQGVKMEDMLTYTVISSLMAIFFTTCVEDRVIDSIIDGIVATDMMKPINLYGMYFAEDFGNVISLMFQNGLPIFLIACVFIKIPNPPNALCFFAFLISLILGFLINWMFAAIFSMWAFSAISMKPMVHLKRHIVRLLSGSIVPMWFFPEWMQSILNVLPFKYMYQLPLSIYIGKISIGEVGKELLIQTCWIFILIIIFVFLEKKMTKKVMIQGG